MGLMKRKLKTKVIPRPGGGIQNDLNAGYVKVTEQQLRQTGLRGTKLIIVLVVIVVLWLIALATMACNILILVILRMNQRGMESLQFLKWDNNEHVIQFIGKDNDLGTVVQNSGIVTGTKDDDFLIDAEKILFSNNETDRPLTMIIENDKVKFHGANNFLVADANRHVLFNATKPKFSLRNSIKTLAATVIKTNKIRAPIDQHLKIDVEDLIFRGNEGNYFLGRNIFLRSKSRIYLRTSDAGAMNFTSAKGYRLSTSATNMHISESPAISANQLGRRLCACINTGKLFTVPGNKECAINPAYCY